MSRTMAIPILMHFLTKLKPCAYFVGCKPLMFFVFSFEKLNAVISLITHLP